MANIGGKTEVKQSKKPKSMSKASKSSKAPKAKSTSRNCKPCPAGKFRNPQTGHCKNF